MKTHTMTEAKNDICSMERRRFLANEWFTMTLMATVLSHRYGEALRDGRFRIGPAQKALNLYLKYMWCVGEIPTPPHCPFDSKIIYHLRGCEDVKWTKLVSLDEYMKLVRTARQEAKGRSLAEWELKVFNEEAWGS
jgi:hypothetical protein